MSRPDPIREKFLRFFEKKNHTIIPSDSLVPSGDPTLLFTSAGMVQFKKYFLGENKGLSRVVSCQKCFRTSDIDEIGRTPRHLSFFEMLGNFSFGDYFKKEAIEWGWEFLTKDMSLPENKLCVTVYKDDSEAYDLWKQIVPEKKIYKLSEKTNFWSMGPTGPCGPCSEIIFDSGEESGCGKKDCSPVCDCDRGLEIWNLVFTQFDRDNSGKLTPLPRKNIDTGMGLERLSLVVNKKKNVFETDLFLPIINELEKTFECKYGSNKKNDILLNIISDHVRAITFLTSDGVLPSNEGRGYVLRRLIRRAVRQAKLLDYNEPFLYKLTNKVVSIMKGTYSDLYIRRENIAMITKLEEEKFIETLDVGINMLNEMIEKVQKTKKNTLSGKDVFYLHNTYGFPPELTEEILAEHKLTYNEEEFIEAQKSAKEIAKTSWRGVKVADINVYNKFGPTEFVGYEKFSSESTIKGIVSDGISVDSTGENKTAEIIIDKTPFYAESGGQAGDKGRIYSSKASAEVTDTQKTPEGVFIHSVKVTKDKFSVGDKITAEIDIEQRKSIMRHHTVTHLLHKALREVVGGHAAQSGSLVSPERLRFDFTHFSALDKRQLDRIEDIVNSKILDCLPVKIFYTELNKAREYGAMALFGEKYGERVRTVMVGGIENEPKTASSLELCGGTHISNTGEIGYFKIISESSIGSGGRRIEALAGKPAMEYVRRSEEMLNELCEMTKSSRSDLKERIETLNKSQKELEKKAENLQRQILSGKKAERAEYTIKNFKLIVQKIDNIDEKTLRSVADEIKNGVQSNSVIVVLNQKDDKMSFVIVATQDVAKKDIKIDSLVKKFVKELNWSGGGREDFAQGGGKTVDIKKITAVLKSLL